MDEFVSQMADRKTEKLMYGGIAATTKFMADQLKLAINAQDYCVKQATEAIAVRNVVVHDRGRVNERFLKLTGRTDLKLGDLVPSTSITRSSGEARYTSMLC